MVRQPWPGECCCCKGCGGTLGSSGLLANWDQCVAKHLDLAPGEFRDDRGSQSGIDCAPSRRRSAKRRPASEPARAASSVVPEAAIALRAVESSRTRSRSIWRPSASSIRDQGICGHLSSNHVSVRFVRGHGRRGHLRAADVPRAGIGPRRRHSHRFGLDE
jgi:hypothetical protein